VTTLQDYPPLSTFLSLSVLPDLPSVCKGFTLLTFVGTEWLEDWRGTDRKALDGEMSQLKGDVEEFDP
jgi:hypothetical protein